MSAALERIEPAWLQARRVAAMGRFTARGLPSPKDEAWRFTNLRALISRPANGTARLTLKTPASGLPEGVRFSSLSTLLEQEQERLETLLTLPDTDDAFAMLNMAMFREGYVLEIAPGVQLSEPLEVLCANEGGAVYTRGIVLLGEGAQATLAEHYTGTGWTNAVTHVALAAGARLRHVKQQTQALEAVHLAVTTITLGDDADHESVVLTLGGGVSREAITAVLAGEGAAFSLRGAYLLGGKQEASIVPEVQHLARHCTSRQLVKGVLGGEAHGVFLGHIGVPEGSDGTDARQTNRNILLSAGARVDTRPRLEILADDVKCSHGATVGDLDETALFYLESRGILPHEARRMLIEAFAAEIVDEADLGEPLRAVLLEELSAWADTLA